MASTYTDTRKIILSSNHGRSINSTYKSNMMFDFQGILSPSETDIIQTQISLDNAQIPVSFYTIRYTNNILAYVANGLYGVLSIPPGNYNFNTLSSRIEILLNAQTIPVTFSIEKVSGIVSITKQNSPTTLSFVPVENSILPILGGLPDTTYSFSANNLTFPLPMNLLGVKRLSIVSNLLPVYSYSTTGIPVLATIAVDQPSFGIINFQNNTQLKHILRINHIASIDLQIYDEAGQYINFNGADWTICLTLEILRKLVIPTTNLGDFMGLSAQADAPPPEEDAPPQDAPPPEPTEEAPNLTTQDVPEFMEEEDADLALLSL